jgi:cyclopropane-fatty-acyl-phospholipid synthase
MIEAVGYRYYDTYFNVLSTCLAPDGMLLIQAIIIDDRVYDLAIKSVDFIQRYIFPGSSIPSVTAIITAVKRATDMCLFHCEDITQHYVRTLQEWRKNFTRNTGQIKALGYPDEFIRMWEFYLCYCEGGFAERAIGDVQMLFTKPLCRRSPLLGVLA